MIWVNHISIVMVNDIEIKQIRINSYCVTPAPAKAEIIWENKVNTMNMTADVLACTLVLFKTRALIQYKDAILPV